jgi:hypothetical protein
MTSAAAPSSSFYPLKHSVAARTIPPVLILMPANSRVLRLVLEFLPAHPAAVDIHRPARGDPVPVGPGCATPTKRQPGSRRPWMLSPARQEARSASARLLRHHHPRVLFNTRHGRAPALSPAQVWRSRRAAITRNKMRTGVAPMLHGISGIMR